MNDLNPYREDHLTDSLLESQVRTNPISRNSSDAKSSVSSSVNQSENIQSSVSSSQSSQSDSNRKIASMQDNESRNTNAAATSAAGASERIDPIKVKMFFMMLAKACKRHEIRMQAHQDFHDHIHKIKSAMTTTDYDQSNFNQDLEELKKKVGHLISVEKNPDAVNTGGKYNQERIALLEAKINKLMQSKMERDQRFEQLESRINTKLDADKQMIDALEKKLLVLQKKLLEKRMSTRSTKSKQGIDLLRKQIQKTQETLEDIKNRQNPSNSDNSY